MFQPLPGARKVPLGRVLGRREGRRKSRTWIRTIHGSWLQDDHHWRRVSTLINKHFLFNLYSLHPQRAKYPWVGCLEENEDTRTPHANSLFMAADSTMITIGGGYVAWGVLVLCCRSTSHYSLKCATFFFACTDRFNGFLGWECYLASSYNFCAANVPRHLSTATSCDVAVHRAAWPGIFSRGLFNISEVSIMGKVARFIDVSRDILCPSE